MVAEKTYSRGIHTARAKEAMLGLIAALLCILVAELFQPALIRSLDDLPQPVKSHPALFYVLEFPCMLLAVYACVLQKRMDVHRREDG